MNHIVIILTFVARNNFVFVPWFRKQIFGIVISWVGGKNYHEK